jgi:thioredoxin 1
MTTVTETTDDRFTADVLESDHPVVVDFTAAWCPPCRLMKPVLAELAAERPDLRVVQLDVDENPGVTVRYGVLSMPTFMVFAGGAPVARLVGARPKARLAREISEALAAAREQMPVEQPARG